jgi:predicted DNA-binding protein
MTENEISAKDKLDEIATKCGSTVEDIVKLVIQATKDDVEFAKLQVKAGERLKQAQKSQFEILKAQNEQMEARIVNYELRSRMEQIWPTKETPKPTAPSIETIKPTIIMPGQG